MIEISRSRCSAIIKTVYFARDQCSASGDADLIGYVQVATAYEGFDVMRTLHIDLTLDEDRLFSEVAKSTKNQINRASKQDNLTFIAVERPTESDILIFQRFYNQFASGKGTTLCGPYHVQTLKLLMRQEALVITKVCNDEGAPLCCHAYVVDGHRAMLHYSGSDFRSAESRNERNRMARANRFLHWQDILLFKERGLEIHDCGGLTKDSKIAEFKRSFGGNEIMEYTGYVAVTWKGRIALACRTLLFALRRRSWPGAASSREAEKA